MLIKTKVTDYGIEANIWKLGYISIDRVAKYGSISMNLYVNENAVQYIESITQVIDEKLFDDYFENTADIYEMCEKYMLDNNEFFCDGAIQKKPI